MAASDKFCPLGFYSFFVNKTKSQEGGGHRCIGNQCQWWEELYDESGNEFGQCAAISLAESMRLLVEGISAVPRAINRVAHAARSNNNNSTSDTSQPTRRLPTAGPITSNTQDSVKSESAPKSQVPDILARLKAAKEASEQKPEPTSTEQTSTLPIQQPAPPAQQSQPILTQTPIATPAQQTQPATVTPAQTQTTASSSEQTQTTPVSTDDRNIRKNVDINSILEQMDQLDTHAVIEDEELVPKPNATPTQVSTPAPPIPPLPPPPPPLPSTIAPSVAETVIPKVVAANQTNEQSIVTPPPYPTPDQVLKDLTAKTKEVTSD